MKKILLEPSPLPSVFPSIDINLPDVFVPFPGKPKVWLPITVSLADAAGVLVPIPTFPPFGFKAKA